MTSTVISYMELVAYKRRQNFRDEKAIALLRPSPSPERTTCLQSIRRVHHVMVEVRLGQSNRSLSNLTHHERADRARGLSAHLPRGLDCAVRAECM